ncbi:helix-turn-helix domain containing protein [Maribacter sp.]|nr:helix-turn-helix domain containing protein [Maribacter sp.]
MDNTNSNTQNATFILKRVKDLVNVKRDFHLAGLLNIAPTTLSNWKKRNSIDYKLVIEFCVERGFNLDFVLAGVETNKDNTQIENLAAYLIDKVRSEFAKDLQEIRASQKQLIENLDKLKTKEEIAQAKQKLSKTIAHEN